MKKFLIALLLPLALTACSAPERHEHVRIEYKIRYGTDPNNLDKLFVARCEYSKLDHDASLRNYNQCPAGLDPLDTIDGYTCAVDGKLYLYRGTRTYRTSSAAIVPLLDMYCKVEDPVVSTVKYDLIEDNKFADDIEHLVME